MTGFWEPHTSSIDFCESNYLHNNYIVEYHNTWSSILGISSFGCFGLLYGSRTNPTHEIRNIVAYSVLVLIGLGSAGLHGTLHWIFQSSDELPMIYLVMSFLYICAEVDGIQGKLNYPHLPMILTLTSIFNTVIYYCFQQFYAIFLICFGVELSVSVFWLYQILFNREGRSNVAKNLGRKSVMTFLNVGLPLWILDMVECDMYRPWMDRLPGALGGITFHIVWHFAAGYASYVGIICLQCCRLEELRIHYRVKYSLGVLPTIVTDDQDECVIHVK